MNRHTIFALFLAFFISASAFEVKGIYVNRYKASGESFYKLIDKMENYGMNSAVIDVKYDRGEVSFATPWTSKLGSYEKIDGLEKKLSYMKEKGIRPIARVVCFKDNYMGKYNNHKYAVKYSDGSIFYDAAGFLWVSPYSDSVQEYIIEIGRAAARAGFKEIQFDYIRFPTDGIKGTLVFPEHNGKNGFDIITSFLKHAYEELKPLGVDISADIYGYTVWFDSLQGVMQQMENMAQYTDALYPMVYPSHFSDSLMNRLPYSERTYNIIFKSGRFSTNRIRKYGTKTVLYLQDFTWKSSKMGSDYVSNQINAARDAGAEGFILWNPSSEYTFFSVCDSLMLRELPEQKDNPESLSADSPCIIMNKK